MIKRAARSLALTASVLMTGSFAVPIAAPVAVAAPAATAAATAASADPVYRIMPLGDSITRGGGQTKGRYIGYRRALQLHLKAGAAGFRSNFVGSMSDPGAPDRHHEGHGGWTIDDLAAHVDGWMTAYRPDIVLLHAGTNNITLGDPPAVTAAKLADLIAQIRGHDPDTRIFVAKVVSSRNPGLYRSTIAYQNLIPDVVDRAGANVFLVDQSTVGGRDLYDLTHPNDYGYQKMAYNWYTAMSQVIAGGTWRPATSPYRARSAYICQLHYSLNRERICARRALPGPLPIVSRRS